MYYIPSAKVAIANDIQQIRILATKSALEIKESNVFCFDNFGYVSVKKLSVADYASVFGNVCSTIVFNFKHNITKEFAFIVPANIADETMKEMATMAEFQDLLDIEELVLSLTRNLEVTEGIEATHGPDSSIVNVDGWLASDENPDNAAGEDVDAAKG